MAFYYTSHIERDVSIMEYEIWVVCSKDPLELKEMKLQALLYCFKLSATLPKNLLIVLESLSEYKYCSRPVGAHAVLFRFLLRVLIHFPKDMERLKATWEMMGKR